MQNRIRLANSRLPLHWLHAEEVEPEICKLRAKTLGQRLARIRKEQGFTQQQLAERTGLIQVLISDYEHRKLRLTAEMAVRFADVLGVSTDDLLRGKKGAATSRRQPGLKLLWRMEQIENLPPYRQRALLTTIDGFLAAAIQER